MEEEDEETCLCSYALTGSNLAYQAIYICNTCNDVDDEENNKCCCEACSTSCHAGHDVEFLAYGRGFCDCGERNCNLCLSSYEDARRCLIKKKNLSLDEEGRVVDDMNIDKTESINIDPIKISKFDGLTNESTDQSLRMHCITLSKLSKDTFWINGNSNPRSSLEMLALKIFFHHIEDMKCQIDLDRSGAEYWVQVKGVDNDNESDDTRNLGVDIHYDKDEEIASIFKVGVFPTLSTVTYLSDVNGSAPTVVFQHTANNPVGSPITKAWVTPCCVNKHLCFDGRFLHGAPSQLSQKNNSESQNIFSSNTLFSNLRVTFLVNIWIHHQPSGVQPMPIEIINSLNRATIPINNTTLSAVSLKVISGPNMTDINITTDDIDDDNGNWEVIPFVSDKTTWGKGVDEVGISLRMWLPNITKQYISSSNQNTIQINYNDTECAALLEYEDEEILDEFYDEIDEMNVDV